MIKKQEIVKIVKIVERYYTVTLTKRLQLCKTKQFFKKIR